MTALVRYLLADVLRTQRWLPPLLLFGAVLAMLNSSDAGPPLSAYAGTCVFVYPVAVWLTIVIATAEDPVRRTVTVATAGWGRVHAAVTVLSGLATLLVVILATLAPLLTQPRSYPLSVIAIGFAAMTVCGLTGVGVGVLCARPVVTQHGWSVLLAVTLVFAAFLFGQVPPIGNILGALGRDSGIPTALTISAVCALALTTGATWLARTLGPRRT
ncbi:hypothetical protein GCM10010492_05160 [Saccharothrix mutabilis subsp. mutabilis]|uniref:ABC transporter n=1 Tax=Saccharothrix mutabilis subsp. mutabilis TaxID=66855 RepID=A0ABP3CMJ7_9PSEU